MNRVVAVANARLAVRQHITNGWLTTLMCVFVGCVISDASAQTNTTPTELSVEYILQQKADVQADTILATDIKSNTLDLYDRALRTLEAASVMATKIAALDAVLASATDRAATLREHLATPADVVTDIAELNDSTLDELLALANERRSDLRIAKEELKEKEHVRGDFLASGVIFSDRLVELEQQLRRTGEDLRTTFASQESAALITARQTFLRARQRLQENEIALIRIGLGSYGTLVKLYTLERDAAAAEVARLEQQFAALDALLNERRAGEARQATEAAEASQVAAANLPAPVAALAEENTNLRTELEQLIGIQNEVEERLRTTEKNLARIREDLTMNRERVASAGPSEAIGRLLRRRLQRLPSAKDYRRRARQRAGEIHRATNRRIDIEEAQSEVADPDRKLEAILAASGPDLARFDLEQVRTQTQQLLTIQQNTLVNLQQEYGQYLTRLTKLDAVEASLLASVEETVDFIYEQLFWIKSLPSFSFSDLFGLPKALGWLFSVKNGRLILKDSSREFFGHPASSLLTLLLVFGLVYLRTQTSSQLTHLAAQTKLIRTDRFVHTAKAMLYTIIAASAWPSVLVIAGWHVRADPVGTSYSVAIGQGLVTSAAYLFIFSFWRWILHPKGLGNCHFRWALPVTTDLAKQLHWLSWVLVPAAFIISTTNEYGNDDYISALGRPTLTILMLLQGFFVWRSFSSTSPFTKHFEGAYAGGWLVRTRKLWLPLSLATPLTLAFASLLGYHYTAVELSRLLLATVWFLVGLWILRDVLLRWFYVAERRLRLRAAIRRRSEIRRQEDEEAGADSEIVEIEVPDIDYKSLGKQGRAIVQVTILLGVLLAMRFLWGELLPVFGFLRDTHLPFHRTEIINGVQQIVPVTATAFVVGLLVLFGTLFATRNLSGLLELTLLSRLSIDSGKRYAIITLCRYLVITIGIIVAFSIIGLQWSKLSWLIAAMGVGLGFGLQEIVANFVSGIILLLERPIRIGDLVTVGDATGTVARIQIRATTVITMDRKELLVPNKEFITGRVLNWTLSDEQHRILVNVGIAYGADVGKAMELLMQAAVEHEGVIEDPPPVVTFEDFGDNALGLRLRAYIDSVDDRLTTSTELHQAIYDKLIEAGIPIAFPQRDIHLDTSKPLEIKVSHEDPKR